MAWKKQEVTDWLKGLGLPQEKLDAALGVFGEDAVAAKLGESVMAQADYTRQSQALKDREKQLQADLDKKNREVDSFRQSVVDWKTGKEKDFNDAVTAKTNLEAELASVRTRIKSIGSQYGITDADLAPIMTTANPNPNPANPPARREEKQDDKNTQYLTREEATNLPVVTLVMAELAERHAKLFPGQPFDRVAVYQNAIKNNRSLEAEWKETYKVDDRQATLDKEARDRDIADAEKRGEERARSALLAENPALAVRVRQESHQGSPVLDRARAQGAAAAEEARKAGRTEVVVDENRGVAAAVRAFNQGTYQGGADKGKAA